MLPSQALSSIFTLMRKNAHYPAIFASADADCCPKRLDDRLILLAKYSLGVAYPMVGVLIRLPHQRQSYFGGQRGGVAKRSPPLASVIKKGLFPNHPFSCGSYLLFSRSHPFSCGSYLLFSRSHPFSCGSYLLFSRSHPFSCGSYLLFSRSHPFSCGSYLLFSNDRY